MPVREGTGFSLFWAGRAVSQFGDEITFLALPWLVAEQTASPLAVGLLQAVIFVPVILFGLPVGAMADRRSRRRTMIEADLIRLLLLGSIPLVVVAGFQPSLVQVMVVAFVAGVGRIAFEASAQAFLPDLVPQTEIVRANSRLALTEGLATVLGPTAAGVLIVTTSASGAIAVDALTFGLSALAIGLIVVKRESYGAIQERIGLAMRAGVRATVRNPYVRAVTLISAAGNIGSGIVLGVLTIFLQRTLELEGWQAGIVLAFNGIGGIAGSLLASRLTARIGIARAILIGLTALTLGFFFIGIAGTSNWFITATLGEGLVGLGIVINVIASASLRQRTVPPELLGRVTASYRIVVNGAVALGAVAGGVIGQTAGIREAIGVGVAIYIVVIVGALRTCLNGPDPQGVVTT